MVEKEDMNSLLFKLAVACLYQLTENPLDKIRLIESGMLAVFPKLLQVTQVDTQTGINCARQAVHRMLLDPSHYKHRVTSTLGSLAENFIFENTDREDYALVVDFAELNQFKRLEILFLSSIYAKGITKDDVAKVEDDLPRRVLEAIFHWRLSEAEILIQNLKKRLKELVNPGEDRDDGEKEVTFEEFKEAIELCVQFQLRPTLVELLKFSQTKFALQSDNLKELTSPFLSSSN
jgi:hypothetical protein